MTTTKLKPCCQGLVDRYLAIGGTKETLSRPGHALYCDQCHSRVVYVNGKWFREES